MLDHALPLRCRTATLANGLRVIVRREPKCPIVAVHVYYEGGSAHEPTGKSGLAHLFEHLMFCASPARKRNYFAVLEQAGASLINAKTYEDYTAYFTCVPAAALDLALRMEASRMARRTFRSEDLERQREIVRNELYERAALLDDRLSRLICQTAYPPNHPYARHSNGSLQELDLVGLDDIRRWQSERIGPRRALLVIAGDIEPECALMQVEHFFADLASAPDSRLSSIIPLMPRSRAGVVEGRNGTRGIAIVWTSTAEWQDSRQIAALDLLATILANGPGSRLFERLVAKDRSAGSIGASLIPRAHGSQFALWTTLANKRARAQAEAAIWKEIFRLVIAPPTQRELAHAKACYRDRMIRARERVAGPSGQADQLAVNALASGLAEADTDRAAEVESVSPDEIRSAAKRWLTRQQAFTLHVT